MRTIPRSLMGRKLKRSQLAQQIDHHGAEAIRLDPERADGYVIRSKAAMLQGDTFRASSWASEAVNASRTIRSLTRRSACRRSCMATRGQPPTAT